MESKNLCRPFDQSASVDGRMDGLAFSFLPLANLSVTLFLTFGDVKFLDEKLWGRNLENVLPPMNDVERKKGHLKKKISQGFQKKLHQIFMFFLE